MPTNSVSMQSATGYIVYKLPPLSTTRIVSHCAITRASPPPQVIHIGRATHHPYIHNLRGNYVNYRKFILKIETQFNPTRSHISVFVSHAHRILFRLPCFLCAPKSLLRNLVGCKYAKLIIN